MLDPIDGEGRWWIVWKREVALGVDVVWIDWIEDRALRELDKRGSDAIVRVGGGIWSSYSVSRSAGGVVRKKLRKKMQKWRKKVKLRLSGGSSARAKVQKAQTFSILSRST